MYQHTFGENNAELVERNEERNEALVRQAQNAAFLDHARASYAESEQSHMTREVLLIAMEQKSLISRPSD